MPPLAGVRNLRATLPSARARKEPSQPTGRSRAALETRARGGTRRSGAPGRILERVQEKTGRRPASVFGGAEHESSPGRGSGRKMGRCRPARFPGANLGRKRIAHQGRCEGPAPDDADRASRTTKRAFGRGEELGHPRAKPMLAFSRLQKRAPRPSKNTGEYGQPPRPRPLSRPRPPPGRESQAPGAGERGSTCAVELRVTVGKGTGRAHREASRAVQSVEEGPLQRTRRAASSMRCGSRGTRGRPRPREAPRLSAIYSGPARARKGRSAEPAAASEALATHLPKQFRGA